MYSSFCPPPKAHICLLAICILSYSTKKQIPVGRRIFAQNDRGKRSEQPRGSHSLTSYHFYFELCMCTVRFMCTHLQYMCFLVWPLNTFPLLCLHTLNYSDVVYYSATSTNTFLPLLCLPASATMINTTFVNNPCRRHAGNLSQYSTVTKLLFKPLQYFEASIFPHAIDFCCCLSSYNISEGLCNGKTLCYH